MEISDTDNKRVSRLILHQDDIFSRRRVFGIIKGRYFEVCHTDKKKKQIYCLDLLAMSPESAQTSIYSWPWLIAAVLSLAITAAITLINFTGVDIGPWGYLGGVLSFYLAIGLMVMFFHVSQKLEIFCSQFGRVPLVKMLRNNPDESGYDEFVEQLKQSIMKSVAAANIKEEKHRAGEMRMLRRLCEEGVISREDYTRAKQNILGVVDGDSLMQLAS